MNGSSASAPAAAPAGAPILVCTGLAAKVQARLDVDVAMGAAHVAAPMFVACALEEGVAAAVVSGGALHVLKKSASGLAWTKRTLA